jgi:histone acetyltransferase (RNA polymerase elongator complex component)
MKHQPSNLLRELILFVIPAILIVIGMAKYHTPKRSNEYRPFDFQELVLTVHEFGTSTQKLFKADGVGTPIPVDYIIAGLATNDLRFLIVDDPKPHGAIRQYFTMGKVLHAKILTYRLKYPELYIPFDEVQFEPEK